MVDSLTGLVDIQSQHFIPTELPTAIDYFICKLCTYVVIAPKECPNCQCIYCTDCISRFTT